MILDPISGDPNATPECGYPLPPPDPGREVAGMSRGRYLVPHPDTGVPTSYTRATRITNILDDTYRLERWKERTAVAGLLADDRLRRTYADQLERGASASRLDGLLEDARVAAGSANAAEFGTAVHAWLEAIDQGRATIDDVPDIFREHARQYTARLDAHGIRAMPALCERTVLNSRYNVVGTFDRVYELPDGRLVLGDIKTSKTLEYGFLSIAMQLAAYADATHMLTLDGTGWEPLPNMVAEWAVVAHVPSNAPEHTAMVTFDLNAGRTGLEAGQLVRDLRAGAKVSVPHRHALPTPTPPGRAEQARRAIESSATADDMAAVWTEYQDVWNDDLTRLGHAVIERNATQSNA